LCAPPPPHLHPFPTRRSSDLYSCPAPAVLGTYTYATRPPVACCTFFKLPSTQSRLRRALSFSSGSTVTVRAPVPSGLGPTVISTDRKSTRLNSSHVSISYAVF